MAAGGRQGIEIHIVDMDIPFPVRPGLLLAQNVFLVIVLGALRAVLQHGAHGSIAIDIGVIPLAVAIRGVGEGQLVVGAHQVRIHFPGAGALGAIQDIALCDEGIAILHQHLLHHILDIFDTRVSIDKFLGQLLLGQLGQALRLPGVFPAARFHCLFDGNLDFAPVISNRSAIPFDNRRKHSPPPFPILNFICAIYYFSVKIVHKTLCTIGCALPLYRHGWWVSIFLLGVKIALFSRISR